MQFKIKGTVYKISFSFFASVLLALVSDMGKSVFIFLLSAILHEAVHLLFIYCFSLPPKQVSLTLFGADIRRGLTASFNCNSEIIINASAPVFNIIAGVIFFIFAEISSCFNGELRDFAEANLTLGFFNLLPFYTFDGGNALKYLLLKYFNEKTADNVLTITSIFATAMLTSISVYVFFNRQKSISLFIMCIYMLLTIAEKQKSLDY